jgi:hypothetical protein
VLLLVLILVLVAFGLLLVALVTGTPVWAWISVVISVAAAAALVYDYVQRRAAARQGAERDGALAGSTELIEPPTAAIPAYDGMTEPATEVLPVIRPGDPDEPFSVDPAEETAVISPVGSPPGSSDRPSSAERENAGSAGASSPTVTSSEEHRSNGSESMESGHTEDGPAVPGAPVPVADGADHAANGPASGSADRPDGVTHPSGEAAKADAAQVADRPGLLRQARAVERRGTAEGAEVFGKDAEAEVTSEAAVAEGADAKAGAGRSGLVTPAAGEDEPAEGTAATAGKGTASAPGKGAVGPPADTGGRPGVPVRDKSALWSTPIKEPEVRSRRTDAAAKSETGIGNERTAIIPPVGAASGADTAGDIDRDPATTALPPVGHKPERPSEPAEPDSTAATQAIPPVQAAPPPAEPDEEKPPAAQSTLVATLTDEVVVVDEHPRYHLTGCRLLTGSETIPLPVKEAVEYGFTPCAICAPVRTLAARNRTASSRPG